MRILVVCLGLLVGAGCASTPVAEPLVEEVVVDITFMPAEELEAEPEVVVPEEFRVPWPECRIETIRLMVCE